MIVPDQNHPRNMIWYTDIGNNYNHSILLHTYNSGMMFSLLSFNQELHTILLLIIFSGCWGCAQEKHSLSSTLATFSSIAISLVIFHTMYFSRQGPLFSIPTHSNTGQLNVAVVGWKI
jgi:hypothetical protein